MRFLLALAALTSASMVSAADDEYLMWSATKSGKPGEVEWKKSEKTFASEETAYAEAAKVSKAEAIQEVRVLKSTRPAPKADSPILAGRAAVAPDVPDIQEAQQFTFNKNGTVVYKSLGKKPGDPATFKYTVDGDELWIVWVYDVRVSDTVYKLTKDGFDILKAKERKEKDWFVFEKPGPNYKFKFAK